MSMTWNDNLKQHLEDEMFSRIQRAGVFLHTSIQTALNVPNSGVRVKNKRGPGSHTIYPSPSAPGEPPRKRTGFLQANVTREADRGNMIVRVGVQQNAKYGAYLEFSTSRMAARPFIFATLRNVMPQLQAIMGEAGSVSEA